MATQREIEEARVRLAFLLRTMLRRVDRNRIGAARYRNLGTEMADSLRAVAVASRVTMGLVTSIADRFAIELSEGYYDGADGPREHRSAAAYIPQALAGDLPGIDRDGVRVVSWAMIAQHTSLEAIRIAVNDGPDFFVTFAQTPESPHDVDYFRVPAESTGPRWEGVLPGESMQSPQQHRAWFQVVSPLAHGHDEKAGNVVLFRRQRQVDPFTAQHALVPVITGNAMKGQWRDLFFARMLRLLGLRPEKDLTARRAQELFAGGTIESGADGGTARLDVRRRARATIPAIDLLGGCIEQQIMSGLLRVSDVTLLCRENAWKLYRALAPKSHDGEPLTYLDFAASLPPADDLTILRLGTRQIHRDLPGGDAEGVQMLWNTEAIMPGARLLHAFSLVSLSTISTLAQSCMADLLAEFADGALLGAQTARGYGQVSTTGYLPAEKASPLPGPDEYLAYLQANRDAIVTWLAGPTDTGPAPKKGRGKPGRAAPEPTPSDAFHGFDPSDLKAAL